MLMNFSGRTCVRSGAANVTRGFGSCIQNVTYLLFFMQDAVLIRTQNGLDRERVDMIYNSLMIYLL